MHKHKEKERKACKQNSVLFAIKSWSLASLSRLGGGDDDILILLILLVACS